MRNLPERRVLLRWTFDAIGFVFIFCHNFVVHSVILADYWAGLIFGENSAGYAILMGIAYLYLLPTALLCWAAAAGLKRHKRWARPVGICACGLLLCGFPFLTIIGGLGLYVLLGEFSLPSQPSIPVSARPSADYWNSKRRSKAQPVVLTIVWIAGFSVLPWLTIYANRSGMPAWNPGWRWWAWYSVFVLINTALHESGHAIVAWAAGFKVRVICIGPFTFWREHSGFQFHFNPGRLFERDGYMGAVPVSDRNLRRNQIAVIAAGPATNALTSLVSTAIFVSLPGTEWQNWWWIAAFNAVIASVMAVGNLIPLGYCDGSMLLHLILGTQAGRLLLDRARVNQMGEEADALHGEAAFDKEIDLKRAMLERSLAFGRDNDFMIAACHQTLASAYALVDNWPAAEFHYRECLEYEAELAANPALAGNVWSGIQLASIGRHHPAAAAAACSSAVAILEKQKAGARAMTQPVVTLAMLAQAHERNRAFETALGEVEQGLRSFGNGSGPVFLRAHLLRSNAVCHLHLGEVESGLAAARAAADLYSSPAIPAARRNLAWENLTELGHELWRAGQTAMPIELMREGISHLESAGAAGVAAQYRVKLTAILRQLGRLDEAQAELPPEPPRWPALGQAFLAERAQLHLACGRVGLAIADCRDLAALWRAHPFDSAVEIASADALLAKVCLAAGCLEEAETLAAQALDVLRPWQHPDAASCLITIALVRSQSGGEDSSGAIGEAFRLMQTAALLGPAEQTRWKEAEMARLYQSPSAAYVLA